MEKNEQFATVQHNRLINKNQVKTITEATLYKYFNGALSFEDTISTLSELPGYGELTAAELLIEKASVATDVISELKNAQTLLIKSRKSEQSQTGKEINPNIARSMVLQAHLPLFASIYNKQLPEKSLAQMVYQKTIRIGYDLMQDSNRYPEFDESKKQKTTLALSLFSIFSVLARKSIKDDQSKYWFPELATITSQRRSKINSSVNEVLDISILENRLLYEMEETDPNNPIQVCSMLHINPTFYHQSTEYLEPTSPIKVINVHPDLDIVGERFMNNASDIILDCVTEEFHQHPITRKNAGVRLNARTSGLFLALAA
jgi:hypothetical protein